MQPVVVKSSSGMEECGICCLNMPPKVGQTICIDDIPLMRHYQYLLTLIIIINYFKYTLWRSDNDSCASLQMMFGLDCGHRYCTNCWCEYITTKVVDEGSAQSITCAGHNCHITLEDATVMELIQDAKVKLTYQCRIAHSFVEVSTEMHSMSPIAW